MAAPSTAARGREMNMATILIGPHRPNDGAHPLENGQPLHCASAYPRRAGCRYQHLTHSGLDVGSRIQAAHPQSGGIRKLYRREAHERALADNVVDPVRA